MANAITKTEGSFSVTLTDKLEGISQALPKDFNKARFVQNALSLVNTKPELVKDFGQTQVMTGLLRGAMLGLDFFNNECYLVGYGKSLNYQTSYRGQQKLIKKYAINPVKNIYAELVREGDNFETGIEKNQRYVSFKPIAFNSKPIIGAFAVCEFESGEILVETMNMDELTSVRNVSKMANSGAWKTFTGEMYKKVVIRRLCKKIEIDFENPEQKQLFEADTDIETDPREIRNNDIKQNANSVDFEDADVVETSTPAELDSIPIDDAPFV